jgi:hypothetical protein
MRETMPRAVISGKVKTMKMTDGWELMTGIYQAEDF